MYISIQITIKLVVINSVSPYQPNCSINNQYIPICRVCDKNV